MTLLEIIEELASNYDNEVIQDEEQLSERFDEFFPNLDENDKPAMRELFNNWTDSLCKGGEMHSEQYDNYCYVGNYDMG